MVGAFFQFLTGIDDLTGIAYDPEEKEVFYLTYSSKLYRIDLNGTILDSIAMTPIFYGSLTTGPSNALYLSNVVKNELLISLALDSPSFITVKIYGALFFTREGAPFIFNL